MYYKVRVSIFSLLKSFMLSYCIKPTGCNVMIQRLDVGFLQNGRAKRNGKLHLQPQPKIKEVKPHGKEQDYACKKNGIWMGMRNCSALPDIFLQPFEKAHQKKKSKQPSLGKALQILKVYNKIVRLLVKEWTSNQYRLFLNNCERQANSRAYLAS